MVEHEIIAVTGDDYDWAFRTSTPKLVIGRYGVHAEFDPFPAYAHDEALVERTLVRVMRAWAPGTRVVFWLTDLEEVGRSNGFSCRSDHEYDPVSWNANVLMSGKRIPPHPALTRYLVAHEYGHHVEWWLEAQRDALDKGDVVREYSELREIGDGKRWHELAIEVFANDFRIMCTGIEPGYWPHPEVTHPYKLDPGHPCWAWWDAQRAFAGPIPGGSSETP